MKRVLTILLVVVLALSLGTVFAPAQKAMAADGIYNVPSPSYPTIQAAIDAAYAAGGGTVNVAPGVYREFISLKSGVKVLGAGWNVTALDGGGTNLLVLAQNVDSTAVLSGFTITNGKFAVGAIFLWDSSPVITDCFIIGNEGDSGGGMGIWGGSPTVTNCTFYANKAFGGGGGMYNSGTATVTNCTFYANEANEALGYGGGMYNSGTATVTNCSFFLNEANRDGGGMYNSGTATVTNCTFSTNKASILGGGMYNSGTATVTNCTFSTNKADKGGGGMYNESGSPATVTNCTFFLNEAREGGGMWNGGTATVTNCTFYANEASIVGGGMYIQSLATVTNCTFYSNEATEGGGMCIGGDVPTVTNCVLWGDTAATGAEVSPPGKDVTYCDVQGGYGGVGNKDADPMFADPGNLDFHLLPGSPCIDAGNDDAPGLPATDFEGDPRIMGAAVDMGVDEFVPTVANEPPVAQDDSATTDEDTPVTINVLANDSDPDEDDLTVVEVTQGANGSVAINEDDTVTYTPNPGFYGTDTFTYTISDGKGGTATATVTVTVNPLVIQVTIDIKPGSEPNSINLGSKGVVPVAVLTTDDFDAGRVDPATVVFAGAAPERWTSEDVDGDGDPDLLFHFRTQELDLTEDSEDATLTGWTTDGHEITGTDSVRIVPPKGKK